MRKRSLLAQLAMLILLPATVAFAAQERQANADQPVRISGGAAQGHLVQTVMPKEPEEARREHIGGIVVCKVLIDEQGHVAAVEPISGPELLRPSYVAAIRQWTYRPFLRDGRPVRVQTIVSIAIQRNGG